MATKKVKWFAKNGDLYHPETQADNVLYGSGTVKDALDSVSQGAAGGLFAIPFDIHLMKNGSAEIDFIFDNAEKIAEGACFKDSSNVYRIIDNFFYTSYGANLTYWDNSIGVGDIVRRYTVYVNRSDKSVEIFEDKIDGSDWYEYPTLVYAHRENSRVSQIGEPAVGATPENEGKVVGVKKGKFAAVDAVLTDTEQTISGKKVFTGYDYFNGKENPNGQNATKFYGIRLADSGELQSDTSEVDENGNGFGGARISFGDGDNAYIQEYPDDYLTIHAENDLKLGAGGHVIVECPLEITYQSPIIMRGVEILADSDALTFSTGRGYEFKGGGGNSGSWFTIKDVDAVSIPAETLLKLGEAAISYTSYGQLYLENKDSIVLEANREYIYSFADDGLFITCHGTQFFQLSDNGISLSGGHGDTSGAWALWTNSSITLRKDKNKTTVGTSFVEVSDGVNELATVYTDRFSAWTSRSGGMSAEYTPYGIHYVRTVGDIDTDLDFPNEGGTIATREWVKDNIGGGGAAIPIIDLRGK